MIERLRVPMPAGQGEVSSQELTLCADSYSVSVPHTHTHTPSVLPQWHVKDPGRSAKSTGGRLHLNTHTPLTEPSRSGLTRLLSGHSVGTFFRNELTRVLSGNIQPQTSQIAEPLWSDPDLKSGISACELTYTHTYTKSAGGE